MAFPIRRREQPPRPQQPEELGVEQLDSARAEIVAEAVRAHLAEAQSEVTASLIERGMRWVQTQWGTLADSLQMPSGRTLRAAVEVALIGSLALQSIDSNEAMAQEASPTAELAESIPENMNVSLGGAELSVDGRIIALLSEAGIQFRPDQLIAAFAKQNADGLYEVPQEVLITTSPDGRMIASWTFVDGSTGEGAMESIGEWNSFYDYGRQLYQQYDVLYPNDQRVVPEHDIDSLEATDTERTQATSFDGEGAYTASGLELRGNVNSILEEWGMDAGAILPQVKSRVEREAAAAGGLTRLVVEENGEGALIVAYQTGESDVMQALQFFSAEDFIDFASGEEAGYEIDYEDAAAEDDVVLPEMIDGTTVHVHDVQGILDTWGVDDIEPAITGLVKGAEGLTVDLLPRESGGVTVMVRDESGASERVEVTSVEQWRQIEDGGRPTTISGEVEVVQDPVPESIETRADAISTVSHPDATNDQRFEGLKFLVNGYVGLADLPDGRGVRIAYDPPSNTFKYKIDNGDWSRSISKGDDLSIFITQSTQVAAAAELPAAPVAAAEAGAAILEIDTPEEIHAQPRWWGRPDRPSGIFIDENEEISMGEDPQASVAHLREGLEGLEERSARFRHRAIEFVFGEDIADSTVETPNGSNPAAIQDMNRQQYRAYRERAHDSINQQEDAFINSFADAADQHSSQWFATPTVDRQQQELARRDFMTESAATNGAHTIHLGNEAAVHFISNAKIPVYVEGNWDSVLSKREVEQLLLAPDWRSRLDNAVGGTLLDLFPQAEATLLDSGLAGPIDQQVLLAAQRMAVLLDARDWMRDHGLIDTPEYQLLFEEVMRIKDRLERFQEPVLVESPRFRAAGYSVWSTDGQEAVRPERISTFRSESHTTVRRSPSEAPHAYPLPEGDETRPLQEAIQISPRFFEQQPVQSIDQLSADEMASQEVLSVRAQGIEGRFDRMPNGEYNFVLEKGGVSPDSNRLSRFGFIEENAVQISDMIDQLRVANSPSGYTMDAGQIRMGLEQQGVNLDFVGTAQTGEIAREDIAYLLTLDKLLEQMENQGVETTPQYNALYREYTVQLLRFGAYVDASKLHPLER